MKMLLNWIPASVSGLGMNSRAEVTGTRIGHESGPVTLMGILAGIRQESANTPGSEAVRHARTPSIGSSSCASSEAEERLA